MKTINKFARLSLLSAIFLTAILMSAATSTGVIKTAFSQSMSNQTVEEMNQTASELNQTLPESMNQTATEMNQSAAQMGSNQSTSNQSTSNQSTSNQTQSTGPKLTTSDVEDIRDSLEQVKKSISDGKAVDALKTINEIDDKLLVAMSENPPPMLEKSTDNNNDDN